MALSHRPLTSLSLLLSASVLLAQAPAPSANVEVTATRFPEDPGKVPASITILTAKELAERGATDLRSALSLLAGVSNVIPYSPYITALPLALLFSALDGAGPAHLLVLVLVFEGVQKVEGFYLTPVWVGKASGLHPLEVLLAIFCFGFTFGLVGLIFAVPLMIVAKALFRVLVASYKSTPWFTGT